MHLPYCEVFIQVDFYTQAMHHYTQCLQMYIQDKVSMHEPSFPGAQDAHFQHRLELLATLEAVWTR